MENSSESGRQDSDLPRSPSGRVPQWVIQERLRGVSQQPSDWRPVDHGSRESRSRRRARKRAERGAWGHRRRTLTTLLAILVVGFTVWGFIGAAYNGKLMVLPNLAAIPFS